jgi:hypothetical protein
MSICWIWAAVPIHASTWPVWIACMPVFSFVTIWKTMPSVCGAPLEVVLVRGELDVGACLVVGERVGAGTDGAWR